MISEISNRVNFLNRNIDKDFMMMSKNFTYRKVSGLLSKNRIVICNLTDREGKIGDRIISINNNFELDFCELTTNRGQKCILQDRFLYNLIYNNRKNRYSLEEHDEYFEK